MAQRFTHNSFTSGESDPALLARYDIELYTKTARRLRNIIPLWTGAGRIRPGTSVATEGGNPFFYIDRTNGNAPITDPDQIKSFMYEYDGDEGFIYTISFVADTTDNVAIEIFYNNQHQVTIAGDIGGTNVWQTAWIPDLQIAGTRDRILIFYGERQTAQLRRNPGAAHNNWTLSWFQPSTYPVFDFSTIDPATTNYRVAGFTFTPSAVTGAITITASAAVYTDNHVGGVYESFGANPGVARITAINAAGTVANATVIANFAAAAAIQGTNSFLGEVMFSPSISNPPPAVRAGTDRGWPQIGAFYNGRLVVGRTNTLRSVAAFSAFNVATDFDDTSEDAQAGFSSTLIDGMQDIIAEDALIFLGTRRNYATNPLTENPLTVATFYAPPQGQDSSGTIRAVSIDNQVLHPTINGDKVVRVTYSTADAKYISTPASLLSNHLINTINSNAGWLPQNITAKLYLATQEDGTLLTYNTLIAEGVNGWSLQNTRGDFLQVFGAQNLCDVNVTRQINLGASSYSSRIDYGYKTDSDFLAFKDITAELANGATDVSMFDNQNEYILLGNDTPFNDIAWILNTVASASIVPEFEYLDGNGYWTSFVPTDNTNGFQVSNDMNWAFTDVGNWQPATISRPDGRVLAENKFWIRIRRTVAVLATVPIENDLSINTADRIFLERLSFDDYMDCQVNTTSAADGSVAGLTHLAGEQVYGIANGSTIGPFFVDATGATNVGEEFDSIDIGLQYHPLLRPMPVYAPTQEGDNIYQPKKIMNFYIDYLDSLYIRYNTEVNSELILGSYVLGDVAPPETGFKKYAGSELGWDPRTEIDITQDIPGPMTIIGIGYEVEVT